MYIAIPSEGPSLDDMMSPRFARAPWFLIIDTEGNLVEAVDNEAKQAAHGAGGVAVQILADKSVSVVFAPRVGPKASASLQMAKMKVYEITGVSCREAFGKYNEGGLREIPLG